MRLKPGEEVRLFNGEDGEWLCRLERQGKRDIRALCLEKTAARQLLADIDYLFAPLKSARLDYMVQKATELGVRRLCPVLCANSAVLRVKQERMEANVIEAAEQCNLVALPSVMPLVKLGDLLANWPAERHLVFCDEAAPRADAIATLRAAVPDVDAPGPLAVLVGPEGGFDQQERAALRAMPGVSVLSLGPRIMRADTAGVAVLALLQAILGDWRA